MSNETLVQHRSIPDTVAFLSDEQKLKDRFPGRFIFVSTFAQYKELCLSLRQNAGVVLHLSEDCFCHGPDVFPKLDEVIQFVTKAEPKAILLEAFGEYLRLAEKNQSFSQKVKSLLELECHSAKRVWVPVFCAKSIFFSIVGQLNHRYENALYEIDPAASGNSGFVLNVYHPAIQNAVAPMVIHGIKDWLKHWEKFTIASGAVLITRQTALFTATEGDYSIRVISDPFVFLQEKLNDAGALNKAMGSPEQWGWLAGQITSATTTVEQLIKKELNVLAFDPLDILSRWTEKSAAAVRNRWLFWLWYHSGTNSGNDYCSYAVSQADRPEDIPERIELAILDARMKNNIDSLREQRKEALRYLKTEKRSPAFWDKWKSVPDHYQRLKLLTDDTREERIEAIRLVGKMLNDARMFSDILHVVQTVYPALARYLEESAILKDSPWQTYFSMYKQQKVRDVFDSEIDDLISKPQLLSTESRHQILSAVREDNDFTLIVDGLGVEWIDLLLYFVQEKRRSIKYQCKIGSAKIPTITSANHFWDDWAADSCRKNDRLDAKSHIKDKSDGVDPYALTELQFSIIMDLADEILNLLDSKGKLIVTADHGLSRLAAIHFRQLNPTCPPPESEVCRMGRYCLVPENSCNSNEKCYKDGNHLLMLTHDHFSCSGYLPGETHGGMTPEEYLVPVLVFYNDAVSRTSSKKQPVKYTIQTAEVKLNGKNQAEFFIDAPGAKTLKAQANNETVYGEKVSGNTWRVVFSSLRSGKTYELKVLPDSIAAERKERITILTRGMVVEDDF